MTLDCFFFSSRRRHTRCALVTEFRRVLFRSHVQRLRVTAFDGGSRGRGQPVRVERAVVPYAERSKSRHKGLLARLPAIGPKQLVERPEIADSARGGWRSEERRVGRAGGGTCRSQWVPYS